ncbi:helix-turn-helix domain-containing protein [Nocardiopsis lambiniae]|uniref:Helix-turn-helix domain-containing protein n=1 Tax=Nocardiopsis lambiniae TaxID=3075539 RepID=A0ABU2M6T6_9ACTN|nr:helix-turn-helix domain-containing protein [Nocardiopsis sp. DSM 44743]MDT0328379.1 helix-turn-helix domain-containing protein [Nocardiopsis sp. DSM 44743]
MTEQLETSVTELPKLLVSVRKAAEILDISERVVYELCYTHELESVKVGPKKWIRRITCESLSRYVEKARLESHDVGEASR